MSNPTHFRTRSPKTNQRIRILIGHNTLLLPFGKVPVGSRLFLSTILSSFNLGLSVHEENESNTSRSLYGFARALAYRYLKGNSQPWTVFSLILAQTVFILTPKDNWPELFGNVLCCSLMTSQTLRRRKNPLQKPAIFTNNPYVILLFILF